MTEIDLIVHSCAAIVPEADGQRGHRPRHAQMTSRSLLLRIQCAVAWGTI
jgi:hypothetical protein